MKKMFASENGFLLFGLTLVVLGSLPSLIPLERWIPRGARMIPDPFAGTYLASSPIQSAIEESKKQQKLSLPEPRFKEWIQPDLSLPAGEEAPTPSPPARALPRVHGPGPIQAFLLEPRSQAILRRLAKAPTRVIFHFEIFPRELGGTLEIRHNGRIFLEIPFEPSPDGAHRTGAMLTKPGVYQWRIVSEGFKGDYRLFTIRP